MDIPAGIGTCRVPGWALSPAIQRRVKVRVRVRCCALSPAITGGARHSVSFRVMFRVRGKVRVKVFKIELAIKVWGKLVRGRVRVRAKGLEPRSEREGRGGGEGRGGALSPAVSVKSLE